MGIWADSGAVAGAVGPGLEAKSRTPLEPADLWHMVGCDGDFCILIEDSLKEKASGL